MSFRLRPRAEADLEAIALFIAQDSPPAARRWLDDIEQRLHALGEMPGLGMERSDIRPGLRLFPAGNYLILYQAAGTGIEVVRVIHGARQWQDLL